MREEWIVDSDKLGKEVFADFDSLFRRVHDLLDVEKEAKNSISITLPDDAPNWQRAKIEELGYKKPFL